MTHKEIHQHNSDFLSSMADDLNEQNLTAAIIISFDKDGCPTTSSFKPIDLDLAILLKDISEGIIQSISERHNKHQLPN